MTSFQHSLKTRILFVTGSIILLVMMLVSLTILFQWRKILIEKQVLTTQSIADAFTVPALDALIYAEQRELLKDDLLETYIVNFTNRVKNIEYVIIFDTNYEIIAGKDRNENRIDPGLFSDSIFIANHYQSVIHNSDTYGWIMDVYTPLKIGNKFWGTAKIGFDAEPIREEIKDIFLVLFSLTILISIVTLTVLYILVNRITFSMHRLVKQIDKIDFENIEEIKIYRSKDEIGFLIERFDDLLIRLKKSKEQLAIAQRQVYQSEKLASIGRLASGIAHEINNPLNGIKNCIYVIKKEPDNKVQTKEYIDLANEGIFYIENVIKKLLGFVRHQPQTSHTIDINDLILNVSRLLDYKLKQKQATIDLKLANDLPNIYADQQLIQEVIMNILINAYDAIADKGRIEILSGKKDKNLIFFSIKDNGKGINSFEMEKIFDPFYTTNDPGEGTGLGLWVSLGIIENHNGQIEVNSVPDKETIFTIFLPIEVTNENNVSRR